MIGIAIEFEFEFEPVRPTTTTHTPILSFTIAPHHTTMVNVEAQFNKAVEIVQGLPKDGPVQPSNDDKLEVL